MHEVTNCVFPGSTWSFSIVFKSLVNFTLDY